MTKWHIRHVSYDHACFLLRLEFVPHLHFGLLQSGLNLMPPARHAAQRTWWIWWITERLIIELSEIKKRSRCGRRVAQEKRICNNRTVSDHRLTKIELRLSRSDATAWASTAFVQPGARRKGRKLQHDKICQWMSVTLSAIFFYDWKIWGGWSLVCR